MLIVSRTLYIDRISVENRITGASIIYCAFTESRTKVLWD